MANVTTNTSDTGGIASTVINAASSVAPTNSDASVPTPAVSSDPSAAPATTTSASTTPNATLANYTTKFHATQGWYITGAIVVSTMLANTGAAPFLLGVLGVALIWQLDQLLTPTITV